MSAFDDLALTCRRIFVEDLKLETRIGIYPSEIRSPQTVLVTIEVWLDKNDCAEDIRQTANYDDLADAARQVLLPGHINLVETATDRILARVCSMPGVQAARVACRKPHAVAGARAAGVEVCWKRSV